MMVLNVRNVQEALPRGLELLENFGQWKDSRAGRVLVYPMPVTTVYRHPEERVLFWGIRDANPFFHLLESLWMLSGSNDVNWLAMFNKRMLTYSDDGYTLHGAYGWRWRNAFGVDQLERSLRLLANNPQTRRAVVQMWDCRMDLHPSEQGAPKDIPCNDLIMFWLNNNDLEMTVVCRSNDAIWGAYGANAVHFSVLQEYMAARLSIMIGSPVGIGKYYQISNNFHAYEDVFLKNRPLISEAFDGFKSVVCDPYAHTENYKLDFCPLVDDADCFDSELFEFMNDISDGEISDQEPRNKFFVLARDIAWSYQYWKDGRTEMANNLVSEGSRFGSSDWKVACRQWLARRASKENDKRGESDVNG